MNIFKLNLLVSLTAIITFIQCQEEEEPAINLLQNSNIEDGTNRPSDWLMPPSSDQQPFDLSWSDEEAFSPQKALKISNQTENEPDDFSYWAQVVRQNIPHGRNITLRTMIKGNLTGQGLSLVIRTDGSDGQLQFVTTWGETSITGDFDWTEYSVSLENVDDETNTIFIFLLYNSETTGEVYFDDVTLTVD